MSITASEARRNLFPLIAGRGLRDADVAELEALVEQA
jgi:hypothetical protein